MPLSSNASTGQCAYTANALPDSFRQFAQWHRLTWSGSAELGNLTGAEWAGALLPLAGQGLMCGFYVNELLMRLLPLLLQ